LVGKRTEIDDRQPAVPKTDVPDLGNPHVAAIGAAMQHRVAHLAEHGGRNTPLLAIGEYANHAAHQVGSPASSAVLAVTAD
jgi:hypothetical protein